MSIATVSGSAGLIGSETVRALCARGVHVIGVDNDMRRTFFGDDDEDTRRCWDRDTSTGNVQVRFDRCPIEDLEPRAEASAILRQRSSYSWRSSCG